MSGILGLIGRVSGQEQLGTGYGGKGWGNIDDDFFLWDLSSFFVGGAIYRDEKD